MAHITPCGSCSCDDCSKHQGHHSCSAHQHGVLQQQPVVFERDGGVLQVVGEHKQPVREEHVERGGGCKVEQREVGGQQLQQRHGLPIWDTGGQPGVVLADVGLQGDAAEPGKRAEREGTHSWRQVAQQDPDGDGDPGGVGVQPVVLQLGQHVDVLVPQLPEAHADGHQRGANRPLARGRHRVNLQKGALHPWADPATDHAVDPHVAVKRGPEVPLMQDVLLGAARVDVSNQPAERLPEGVKH
mmetsp:Transcript_22990/g.57934  ORF Transcript_22990/g.57934 Transcript_22990/m.57934 type:complete len:243 (-) Transcript_22990:1046-1774(-)